MTAKPYPEWTTNADGTRTTFGTFDAHGTFTPSETATTTLTETQLSVFQMNPGAGILSVDDAIRIQDGPNAILPDAPAPVVQTPAPDSAPTPAQPAPVAAIPGPEPIVPDEPKVTVAVDHPSVTPGTHVAVPVEQVSKLHELAADVVRGIEGAAERLLAFVRRF